MANADTGGANLTTAAGGDVTAPGAVDSGTPGPMAATPAARTATTRLGTRKGKKNVSLWTGPASDDPTVRDHEEANADRKEFVKAVNAGRTPVQYNQVVNDDA